MSKTYTTPSELALGGQLVSLDPTGQHIVYGISNKAGVMYTTNLADPLQSNLLAMRYALDAAWAPDGSALVTTIYPQSVVTPLLALVPTGQFMHTLGKEALAASWLPTSHRTITYITQVNGQATLWEIGSDGKNAHAIGTMSLSLLAQHLSWSPDGRALVYSDGGVLQSHVLHGSPIQFSNIHASAAYPLWQDNQHILYLSINNSIGQMAQLVESPRH